MTGYSLRSMTTVSLEILLKLQLLSSRIMKGCLKLGRTFLKSLESRDNLPWGNLGEGGRGEVLSKSIELSNVDIANEFVNLMTTQRNFEANAKTLTTADEMLQEVLAIKR